MIIKDIQLRQVTDIQEFNALCNTFPYDMDLKQSRYTVNAKSIMGIFSLDVSKPMDLVIEAEDNDEFIEIFKKFIEK